MILAAALLVLQVQVNEPVRYVGPQCPYVTLLDPPHGKLFCYIWSRLGNPPDRPYLRGVDMGGFDSGPVPQNLRVDVFGDRGLPGGVSAAADVPEAVGIVGAQHSVVGARTLSLGAAPHTPSVTPA